MGKGLCKVKKQLKFLTISARLFVFLLSSVQPHPTQPGLFSALVHAVPGVMRNLSVITIICVLSGLLGRPRTLPPPDPQLQLNYKPWDLAGCL